MNEQDLRAIRIAPSDSIRQAIICIDQNSRGIALVTELGGQLLGTISDGDIRRAMLAGLDLESPVSVILERKKESPYPKPSRCLPVHQPKHCFN